MYLAAINHISGPHVQDYYAPDLCKPVAFSSCHPVLLPITSITSLPKHAQVQVTKYPRIEDLPAQLQGMRPNIVYVNGGVTGDRKGLQTQALRPLTFAQGDAANVKIAAMFKGLGIGLVYLDSSGSMTLAEKLHADGIPHVIAWPDDEPPQTLAAMHFAHAFFSCLRNCTITLPEAFAIATNLTRAFGTRVDGNNTKHPRLPHLLSSTTPALPNSSTVPHYVGPAVAGLGNKPLHEVVPGYAQIRMCAPHAELRMMVAALYDIVNSHSMSHLCEGLRGLLVAEVRSLRLINASPCASAPAYLPLGSAAVRCEVRSSSGIPFSVVLGGPPDVLKDPSIVEYGLRQTLTADAQALQVKLPPVGAPLPPIRTNANVAGGAPSVEIMAVTSVWTVQLLKKMCQDARNRLLVTVGIGAVSSSATAGFSKQDGNRYLAIATGNDPMRLFRGQPPGASATMVAGAQQEGVPRAVMPAAAAAAAAAVAARAAGMPAGALAQAIQGAQAAAQAQAQAQAQVAAARQPPAAAATPAVAVQPPRPASAVPVSLPLASQMPLPSSAHVTLPHVSIPILQSAPAVPSLPPSTGAATPMETGTRSPPLPWNVNRPPLSACTETDFLTDVCSFLEAKLGKKVNPAAFPDAFMNGSRLDMFTLYREVCKRGGYTAANKIDWKSAVFPRMRNYSDSHKMTAVGNVLKHHYQTLLLEYERMHPGDVQKDGCVMCGQPGAAADGVCAGCRQGANGQGAGGVPAAGASNGLTGPVPMTF